MDLKNLQIFVRVAALQNLSGVALEMNLTPGTISKRIQALENDLGVRLIDRTTRSSRLTEEGRMFVVRADRILTEMNIARDEISANSGQPAGRISITAPACLSSQLIKPAMVGFIAAYPAIEVRLDLTDQVANLHEQGYDAAIRTGTLPDSTLKAKRLASDRVLLAASPAYIELNGAPQKACDLEHHACLVQGDQRNWTLSRGEDVETVRVKGQLTSDSGDFLHKAALDGLGILRTSQLAVSADLASGALLEVLPDYEMARDAAIWAVYPNNKHPLPRLKVFLTYLADYCRDKNMASGRRITPGPVPPKLAKGPDGDVSANSLSRDGLNRSGR